jgi:hypothetical protein
MTIKQWCFRRCGAETSLKLGATTAKKNLASRVKKSNDDGTLAPPPTSTIALRKQLQQVGGSGGSNQWNSAGSELAI